MSAFYLFLFIIAVVLIIAAIFSLREYTKGIEYSEKALERISQNICTLCGKKEISKFRLKVGYMVDYSYIPYKFFRIGNNNNKIITGSIPVCEECKTEFLAFRISDPSKTILKQRAGFHRGLINPYVKENIFEDAK